MNGRTAALVAGALAIVAGGFVAGRMSIRDPALHPAPSFRSIDPSGSPSLPGVEPDQSETAGASPRMRSGAALPDSGGESDRTEAWSGSKPLTSAAEALRDASVTRDFDEINAHAAGMTPTEITELFVELRDDGDHPQRAMLEHVLVAQLMGRDPEAMLALKVAYPDLPVLGQTYRLWGETDPAAALKHLQTMENDTWQRQGLNAALWGMAGRAPEHALETLLVMSEADPGHYVSLFGSWGTRAPADAAAAIDRVPEPFLRAALQGLADNWPEVDPHGAREWFDALPPDMAEMARPALESRLRQLEAR